MLTAQHYFSSPRGGSTWLPPVAILGHTRDGEKGPEALVRLLGPERVDGAVGCQHVSL